MKIRAMVLGCLIGGFVLCVGYRHSRAESGAGKSSLKIGVISVRKIFRDCERRKKHNMELKAEEDKISVELNILQKKIAAVEAGLGTVRPESSDYLELERDVRQKRDKYRLEKEYYEQLLGLKDRQWTKEFYEDFLRVTGEVGKERGLDLVFERSEPDFSMVSATELLMTIQTHKLLYTGGCVDITDEVMAGLDKESTKAGTGGGK